MNNLNKIITAYSLCEFIQYVSKNNQDPMTILDEFSKDCEFLGGDKQLFIVNIGLNAISYFGFTETLF
jgi:hypothetical protein